MLLFEDIGDWGGWGWAVGLMAWVRFFEGRLDEAEELASIVMPEVRERGDRWPLGMLTGLVAHVRLWRGDADEAVRRATEARQVFMAIDDKTGEVRSMVPLIRALAATGRIEEAERLVEEAESLAPVLPEPGMRMLGSALAASTAVFLGQGARGYEAAERAEAVTGRTSVEGGVLLGLSRLLIGRVDDALEALEGAWTHADGIGLRANAGSALALARVTAGMAKEAEETLHELGDESGTYLDRQIASWARGFALAQLGDPDGGRRVLEEAVGAVDETSDRVTQALARLALAHLVAATGGADAGRAADDARDRLRALGLAGTDWERVFAAAAANLRQ
jgi:tetratricopeptide (TPR) repeat protein